MQSSVFRHGKQKITFEKPSLEARQVAISQPPTAALPDHPATEIELNAFHRPRVALPNRLNLRLVTHEIASTGWCFMGGTSNQSMVEVSQAKEGGKMMSEVGL